MHVHEFQAKWRVAELTERAAATPHFSDLCAVLGQPTPSQANPSGERYAFEKRVTKHHRRRHDERRGASDAVTQPTGQAESA